jgi:hypothetical protein
MAFVVRSRVDTGDEVFEPGTTVKKSDFDDGVLDHLVGLGSVEEVKAGQDEEDKAARIAELEAQLAALTGGGASGPNGGDTTEQPVSDPAGKQEPSKQEAKKATSQASGPTSGTVK